MTTTDGSNAPAEVALRPGGSDPMAAITARAGYMMGENVDREWTPDHAAAWEGFLELSRRLRRDAQDLLEPHGDLGVSGLGIMGRLLRAPERTLRQTTLANAMGLSVSRISRVVDTLEARELVIRRPCPSDARATNVTLTDAGLAATRDAQDAVFAFVESRFFEGLTADEVRTFAVAFTRLLSGTNGDPSGTC